MIVYKCDLCNQLKDCFPKQIEGRVYDICADCWAPLQEKLAGKGRPAEDRTTLFLTSENRQKVPENKEPFPGQPPDIQYESEVTARQM